MRQLNANSSKLIINSFANGELDIVMELHLKFGNDIFEFVPKRHDNSQRAIFYAFKNGHFNVAKYYMTNQKNPHLSDREVSFIAKHLGGHVRVINWLKGYEIPGFDLESIVPIESMKAKMAYSLVSNYNYNMIDYFLGKYPEYYDIILKHCSGSSTLAKQLKRHLLLKEIIG